MALTSAQKTTLKAFVQADPVLGILAPSPDNAFAIAVALNAPASPAFIVWKTRVTTDEIMSNGFVWTVVDTLTAGKARIWEWMSGLGTINPSKANIRQGLIDAFGAGTAMADGIAPHLKRSASVAEKQFATGTGSTASPATLDFEGTLVFADVLEFMGW